MCSFFVLGQPRHGRPARQLTQLLIQEIARACSCASSPSRALNCFVYRAWSVPAVGQRLASASMASIDDLRPAVRLSNTPSCRDTARATGRASRQGRLRPPRIARRSRRSRRERRIEVRAIDAELAVKLRLMPISSSKSKAREPETSSRARGAADDDVCGRRHRRTAGRLASSRRCSSRRS